MTTPDNSYGTTVPNGIEVNREQIEHLEPGFYGFIISDGGAGTLYIIGHNLYEDRPEITLAQQAYSMRISNPVGGICGLIITAYDKALLSYELHEQSLPYATKGQFNRTVNSGNIEVVY
ncbi:hypothetical protein JW887_06710 [Candidatus Dojkabacteria bacterium]|nr:hypothetical protein [Candidatus Dojkabacteria bacterium]